MSLSRMGMSFKIVRLEGNLSVNVTFLRNAANPQSQKGLHSVRCILVNAFVLMQPLAFPDMHCLDKDS
jgi:hypothetical protein